jgi:bis(5'-nucleosyl)-tetraphosphatase (symmetrical)
MSTYAIGDVQGCFDALLRLLKAIQFNPEQDVLWFTGDLANRGPKPLETLRLIKSLGAICVLGNHDLALLAALEGVIHLPFNDPAKVIMDVPEQEKKEWSHWLRHLPLLHRDFKLNIVMTHAGIYPLWDIHQAMQYAHEVEEILQSNDYPTFLKAMYKAPPREDPKEDRMHLILDAFTRMRFITPTGELDHHAKKMPNDHPNLFPWFSFPHRRPQKDTLIFGHWAALKGQCHIPNIIALDEGCVWGGSLAALCLETKQRFSVPC